MEKMGALWRGVVFAKYVIFNNLSAKVAQAPHEYGFCVTIY